MFNKVAGPRPATLLKKRPWHRCFLVFFVKFLRTPFFKEHLWWLQILANVQQVGGLVTKSIFAFDYSELLQRYAELNRLL